MTRPTHAFDRRHKALLLALFAAVIGLSLGIRPVLGQEGSNRRWTAPLFLGVGWWQSITTDQQGTVYVGWSGYILPEDPDELQRALEFGMLPEGGDVLRLAIRDFDGTWRPSTDVFYTSPGGMTVRNALAVTSNGILNAVFRVSAAHKFAFAPESVAENPKSWTQPIDIGEETAYYIAMTVDRNDILHIVFSGRVITASSNLRQSTRDEARPCAFCHDLFYVRSTDGGRNWSTPFPLSVDRDSGSDRPDIFQGRSGRLYVFWDEGFDWYQSQGTPKEVRAVYSDDGGLSWSDPIKLDGGAATEARPIQGELTELRDGSLLAVWRYSTDDDRKIYYQLSSDIGKTWTEPAPIPGLVARSINEGPLDDYNLLTDRLNTAHLFVVGQPDESSIRNSTLYHIEFRQGTWLAPQRVFYNPQERPEWPKAVLGISNDIHLSWFNRGIREGTGSIPDEDGRRILKIYYSHLPGNVQFQPTQQFRPTNTPPPTPTVFQQIEPSPTPLPTLRPLEQTLGRNTADTYAAETLLAGMGAVALLCGGLVLLLRYLHR